MNCERKNIITYPRKLFVENIADLQKNREILNRLALHQTSETNYWLVSRLNKEDNERHNQSKGRITKEVEVANKLILNTILVNNGLHPGSSNLESNFLNDAHLYTQINNQTSPNSLSGYIKHKNNLLEIDEVFLIGAEMLKIPTINTRKIFTSPNDYELFLESDYARERWQMSRKALKNNAWKRLCQLRYMIVGCGRSGEMMFMELARLGASNISVCDGDDLELRNLGEMKLVTDQDIGRNKAEVVVEKIIELRQTTEETDCFNFQAVKSFNFDSYAAQRAAEESDVIICCVDSDGGRAYASHLASQYYKVLLDIGTGILPSGQTNKIGFDNRLILPDDGCLRCCGGINEEQSEIEIINRQALRRQRQEGYFNRGGSLSRLNSIAVNNGIKILQELCEGSLKNSTWVQYEENKGETILEIIPKNTSPNCDCRQAGLGSLFI